MTNRPRCGGFTATGQPCKTYGPVWWDPVVQGIWFCHRHASNR